MKKTLIAILAFTLLFSCESEEAQKERANLEEQNRIAYRQQSEEDLKAETKRLDLARIEQEKQEESERIQREAVLEEERKEQEIYNKYINNSLPTGSTPYSQYYGDNPICSENGCSQIKVQTPNNSDVLVTIKKYNKVIRHAFIQSGDSYTFSFPNGTYQAFFYYGKGWNPEKEMKNGEIEGGFIENEVFGKDEPQSLHNNVLKYELILQPNGNFSTEPSNSQEAL